MKDFAVFKSSSFIFCFFLVLPMIAFSGSDESSDSDDTPASTEATVSTHSEENEIVVTARLSFCNLEFMQRYAGNLGSFPELDAPQATDCRFGRCHPNYYVGTGATRLRTVVNVSGKRQVIPKEIKVEFYGHHCDTGCTQSAFTKAGIGTGSDSDNNLISLKYQVKKSEIYDAKFNDIKVYCPLETCEAVISAEYSNTPNRVILTQTKSTTGGEPVIKLYVNAGSASTFITLMSDQSAVNKCEGPDFD